MYMLKFLMHVLIKLARDCRVSYLHCQQTYEIISFADATGGTSVFVYVCGVCACKCVHASVCDALADGMDESRFG